MRQSDRLDGEFIKQGLEAIRGSLYMFVPIDDMDCDELKAVIGHMARDAALTNKDYREILDLVNTRRKP